MVNTGARATLVKFSHVHAGVTDLDRALRFYAEKLGLKTQRITEKMGSVSLGTAGLELDLVPSQERAAFAQQKRNVVVAFSVPDIEKYYKELRGRGVTTIDAPTKRPWGSYNFYLLDPDGYKIEVEQQ